MKWPTPKDSPSKNAASNKYLGMCLGKEILIDIPGSRPFSAELIGWDAYSLVLGLANSKVMLLARAPGMKITIQKPFEEEKKDNGSDGQADQANG